MQQQPSAESPLQATQDSPASEIASGAEQLRTSAANRLHSEVDARKGTAATQARSVSDAIQNAAGQLDENAPQWLRSAFTQGAEQIQRFAETIEHKDSRQILDEVNRFARERPALFLGAAAAAGFAAARVLKAGGSGPTDRDLSGSTSDRGQPWGDGEPDGFGQNDLLQQPAEGAFMARGDGL